MFQNFVIATAFLGLTGIVFLVVQRLLGPKKTKNIHEDRHAGRWQVAFASMVPQFSREIHNIEQDLKRAGYYSNGALVEYLATRNFFVILILMMTGATLLLLPPGHELAFPIMISGLIASAMCYGLPRMVLSSQAKSRVARIEKGLPDALDIIRMCLTGGMPLRSALLQVSDEIRISHLDVALEFDLIQKQADANSMSHALRNFAERIDAPDVRALASIVSQTERLGTQVAQAVAEFADGIRRAHRQRAEEQASKTSIKLLFPVIFCLSPPIFILLAGPPVLGLRNFVIQENRPGGVLRPETESLNQPTLLNNNRTARDIR